MAGDKFYQGSDVDAIVIGDISFADVVSALFPLQEVWLCNSFIRSEDLDQKEAPFKCSNKKSAYVGVGLRLI